MKNFILILFLSGFAFEASAQERKLKDTALESKPVQVPAIRAPKLKSADSFLNWSLKKSQPLPASLFESDFSPRSPFEFMRSLKTPENQNFSEDEWMKQTLENSFTLPAVDLPTKPK
jgi:hypothetical protein